MKKVLGIGNALVDIMTRLESDDTLKQFALKKGSMQLVDIDFSSEILNQTEHLYRELSSGGSAANTIHGLSNLGISAGFIGKTGNDSYGKFFTDDLVRNGIQPVLFSGNAETGRAIALISPDSERTFATYLGAAIELSADDISAELFKGNDFFYIEGYLVQNKDLVEKSMRLAKEQNITVVLDLASYNVVEQNLAFLKEMITRYVDVVFANEEEAHAFCGTPPLEAVHNLSEICEIAVVKTGSKGSLVKSRSQYFVINPVLSDPLDTTGAGDAYAAGFIYGMCMGFSLDRCGALGSLLAGKVIEHIGAKMNEKTWEYIHTEKGKI